MKMDKDFFQRLKRHQEKKRTIGLLVVNGKKNYFMVLLIYNFWEMMREIFKNIFIFKITLDIYEKWKP